MVVLLGVDAVLDFRNTLWHTRSAKPEKHSAGHSERVIGHGANYENRIRGEENDSRKRLW